MSDKIVNWYIIVNGVEHEIAAYADGTVVISHEWLVDLALGQAARTGTTQVEHHDPASGVSGLLMPGQHIEIRDGMIFTVKIIK